MGRFFSSYTNRRHNTYGAQILAGDGVHTRGWDAGAKVTPRGRGDDGKQDAFDVYMTTGSHEARPDVLIGTVVGTPDGPRWEPADKPGTMPARIGPMPVIAAIPLASYLNATDPDAYICVVISGHWPSGEPQFTTMHARRNPDGTGWITDDNRWEREMSQVEATTDMIRRAGHARPSIGITGADVAALADAHPEWASPEEQVAELEGQHGRHDRPADPTVFGS